MTKGYGEQKNIRPNLRLREARERMALSHEAVAKAIDLPDPHTVGRWERGISFPRPYYRLRLSELFGKSPEELGLLPQEQGSEQLFLREAEQTLTQIHAHGDPIQSSFTSFIGREASIARICELLKHPNIRLVTILGPGGVGKTRLASEVARVSREQFADAICMVSLSALRDVALVLPTIARELRIREQGGHALLENLQLFLATKPAFLLILDNFEHILNAVDVIGQLLAGCPCLKVLVTSRSVLHISGEHEFTLDPLSLPTSEATIDEFLHSPAIQLFIQRAQARLATFQATPENMPLIGKICATLDSLPLAIELAAARVKLFPLPALAEEISADRLHLGSPKSSANDILLHQQTLADTIKWSYDLLDKQEQWLFRYIAIFPGGCTLPAAKSIWSTSAFQDRDVLSTLLSLLDKNMICPIAQNKTQPFFLMLETMRDYSLGLLQQQGELEAAREALAGYYMELLETAEGFLKGPQQGIWLTTLDQERQNLSTALMWLIESKQKQRALLFCEVFGKFCALRGYWSEEAHWLKATLDLSNAEPATLQQGRVLRRAAHLAYRMRDLPTARTFFEESIVISKELEDPVNLSGALSGLAWVYYREQNLAPVQQLLEQSVAVTRTSGDVWSLANTLESLSRFLYLQGDLRGASQLMEESISLARSIEDAENLSRLLSTSISIEVARQNLSKAAALARESFDTATALGNKPLISLALNSLADVAVEQEDFQHAAELYHQRIQLARTFNDLPTIALMQLRLGEIALQQGNFEQATALAQESLAFFQEVGDNPNSVRAETLIRRKGEEFLNLKRNREAIVAYDEALKLAPHSSAAYKGKGKALDQLAQQVFDESQQQAQLYYNKAKEFGVE